MAEARAALRYRDRAHQWLGHHYLYEGHYPVKTGNHPDEWVDWEWGMVPPHLRDRAFSIEHLYDPGWRNGILGNKAGGLLCSNLRKTTESCVAKADTLSAWRKRLYEPWIRKYRTTREGS